MVLIKQTVNRGRLRAFTLPEMLVALLIFGTGFTMVIASVPYALSQYKESNLLCQQSLLAEAGLANAKNQLFHEYNSNGEIDETTNPFVHNLSNLQHILSPLKADTAITPVPGILLLGRYHNKERNDYQLMAIAHKVIRGEILLFEATWKWDSYDRNADWKKVGKYLATGMMVIQRSTGKYARIIDVGVRNGDKLPVRFEDTHDLYTPQDGDLCYLVMAVTGGTNEAPKQAGTPLTFIKMTRTSLRTE